NEIISSTLIRNLIQDGNIEGANLMLGHEFTVSGIVEEGNKLGRTIGFKTANISYPPDLIEISYGCYSTETSLDGKTYKSITNFGVKPTVNNGQVPLAETHILDFDQDIYGAKIDVNFKFLIRKEIKFASLDELKTQIALDIEKINR
ncbi:bifunctional riboflavin kinase/FAD synthetase, partial [bacterium]|nr:bifunctional riboflavin kinase/FAD synthetase [bacterium]